MDIFFTEYFSWQESFSNLPGKKNLNPNHQSQQTMCWLLDGKMFLVSSNVLIENKYKDKQGTIVYKIRPNKKPATSLLK